MITKARLVARGFEEQTELRTDSPTCIKQSFRMTLISAATKTWKVHSIDIPAAFLQGYEIDCDVYLKPPPDIAEPGFIWKLKRCIYGLNDAPRAWYQRVSNELINVGGKQSTFDPALFLWHGINGALEGTVAAHVDDFVYAGTDLWERAMDTFKCKFKISVEAEKTFRYIGLNIEQREDYIKIDQENYVQLLKLIPISCERAKEEALLDKNEKAVLKSLCGKLQWVTTNTRVDMAYDTCMVSNVGKTPQVQNILEANKAVRKIKNSKVSLTFPNVGNPKDVKIVCYDDATHASLHTGASQGAYLVFVVGNSRAALIS